MTFKGLLEDYLASVDDCKISTLQDLINFNEEHADEELPPCRFSQYWTLADLLMANAAADNQAGLIRALNYNMTTDEYNKIIRNARDACGKRGVDRVLEENDVDIILGPGDGPMFHIPGTAGKSYILNTTPQ
jgi:amidase